MIVNINGREVEGEMVEFHAISEPFACYQLVDGNMVRIKIVLMRAVKTKEKNSDGTPLYYFNQQVISIVDEGEKK